MMESFVAKVIHDNEVAFGINRTFVSFGDFLRMRVRTRPPVGYVLSLMCGGAVGRTMEFIRCHVAPGDFSCVSNCSGRYG
jgi:hypothetical protein